MAVRHGDQQRRRPGADGATARQRSVPLHRLARRRRVHVDARPEQGLHHVDPSFADREQKRREAGVQSRVGVRTDLEQQFDDFQVAFRGRPHERRLAPLGFAEVDVGAGLVERLDDLDPAGPRRGHEHRLASSQHGVGVGARGQERFDDLGVAVGAGQGQRDDAVAVRGGGVGAGVEQAADEVAAIVVDRPVKSGHAVDLGGVDLVGSRGRRE